MQDARARFLGCFEKQRYFDTDRLIGAANAFDILPKTAAPGTTLRVKIQRRASPITDVIGDRFPELTLAIEIAVDCRNHYVHCDHGKKLRINYDANRNAVNFLTETLEFVFAASDLLEAGWNIKRWSKEWTGGGHPFGDYRVDYKESLERLKTLL